MRRASDIVAFLAFPAAFALPMGWPGGEVAAGVVVVGGLVLAVLQYGRGYRRASVLVVASAVLGLLAGHVVAGLVV